MIKFIQKISKAIQLRLQMLNFRRKMKKAAKDPVFMANMQQTMEDFKYIDAETERRINP